MKRLSTLLLAIFLSALVCIGCATEQDATIDVEKTLTEVASSDRQWTGLAVSPNGRIFVNFPRWSDNVSFSVGEVMPNGETVPYPDMEMNRWDGSVDPATHFVAVQSVYIDSDGFLWALDTGNPQFTGVVSDGPKLVKFDIATNEIVSVYPVAPEALKASSYLNDVRIDTASGFAYISDSDAGGIVMLNLESGESRRVLTDHASTRSEGIVLRIGGKEWRRPDGSAPSVDIDGIALSADRRYVYYQALSGRTMYRIGTEFLNNWTLDEDELAAKVEKVAVSGAADGIMFGPDGTLYLSAFEEDAVNYLSADGRVETLVKDSRLIWPDSFSITSDGTLYVTTAQIHLGAARTEPYRIFKIDIR